MRYQGIKIEKSLYYFLCGAGVIDSFVIACKVYHSRHNIKKFKINGLGPAFVWGVTAEGQAHWSILDSRYRLALSDRPKHKLSGEGFPVHKNLYFFLEGAKALSKFIINCRKSTPNRGTKISKIGGGFYWKTSPQGHEYWSELEKQYMKYTQLVIQTEAQKL